MATLADVARAAGVSKSTASRALAGHLVASGTRERVLAVARELDYVASPAAVSLATGKSGMIAAIVPACNTWFTGTLLDGIAEAALELDYDVVLYNLGELGTRRRRAFDHFQRRKHVDAVVSGNFALTADEIEQLREMRMPVAGVGEATDGIRTWCLDDVAAGRIATEHLIGLGHRQIHFVGGRRTTDRSLYAAEDARLRGYAAALAAAGLARPRELRLDPDFTSAYAAGREIFATARHPRALYAATDDIALGLVLAARDTGLDVPGDVSVVGTDDQLLAGPFGLTTLRQRPADQGSEIVRWLAGEIDHPTHRHSHTWVAPELVVRSTTAAPSER
ncbi:LacI family DNA-binding transcriptional regulator [Zhihengliuella halotolerans]|uniref:LacI family transcriptional regulator n=1 Tax=Zhihengliuella halotolerans TaxID=370736 RepID=A0A4Q8A929_9MICC|nr:LacI family DNA-binding transcriptional regulator [Zhihengliuella halotolerans]RZU60518.1 LacI family transcriptional regulator [Zhihengliuella halotolerans]